MQLTLAGPGAGKTTDMIKQIVAKLPELQANRDMALITYTNESVSDIKKKVNENICLPKNVFIGTIHSFLVHYFIIPYAFVLGYKSNPITIVDKFDTTGMKWIDAWVDKTFPDINTRKIRKESLYQKQYNGRRESAARKGIYTYDSIIKISRELALKKDISRLVSNKIQFLFVDEYQDISKYAHDIIMKLEKQRLTQIAVVGDPDQSIYRFRYGSSQIGEKAPTEDKQPIRELMALTSDKCRVRKLLMNYRSSKEIVDFNNKYGTLENQIAEKGSVCKIHYIKTQNPSELFSKIKQIGGEYECADYLVLGKKQKTVDHYKLFTEDVVVQNDYIDLKSITDYVIAKSGESYKTFMEKYEFDNYKLRHVAAELRKRFDIAQLEEKDFISKIKSIIRELYGVSIQFSDSCYLDDRGMKVTFGYSKKWNNDHEENCMREIRYMTIHKSKGLEADCVLVIAETQNEFLKWLNMTPQKMKSLQDEDYRLGYVAFTRAKKVLILSCLQDIDTDSLDKNTFSILC